MADALPALDRAEFDVIVTDLRMPGIDGLEGLKRFRAKVPEIPVIIMTAFATVETAVEAMKAGAFDYLKKPFDPEELEVMVEHAGEHGALRRENRKLKQQLSGTFSIQGMVGKSQGMKEMVSIAERIAPSDVPVLIEGESGTGKDVLARIIHGLSGRAKGPYLALNMSAIPENLAESELFGHEKGAFTGADQARPGFFAEADGRHALPRRDRAARRRSSSPSCCGCSRTASTSRWAAASRRRPTCGWWRPPTRT